MVSRPAVRVICLDGSGRVLLLQWRDPSDGSLLWEPPGGGIEPGESALEAARRELTEETGLDPAAVQDAPVVVERDTIWDGRRFVGPEPFFLAHYSDQAPALDGTNLLPDEQIQLQEYAWLGPADLAGLTGRLEPPTLAAVIATLAPSSPWAD